MADQKLSKKLERDNNSLCERKIPFEDKTDPFYSAENIRILKTRYEKYKKERT